MDGYLKRQAERAELCGAGKEVPHRSANSKAVCGITAKTGVHINRTETDKAGRDKQLKDEWLEEAPYSAVRILEKLQEQGFEGKYSIVKEYVRGNGKWKKLYCFLMILGYSRMRYIEFVTDMSTNTLIRCHQNAFRYFGDCPEEILYENMLRWVQKDEASVVCVGSSTARESRMKFRAGEHDHSHHIVHIAEAKGSADDEFDLVISRLGASIGQLEPCGGSDGREVA